MISDKFFERNLNSGRFSLNSLWLVRRLRGASVLNVVPAIHSIQADPPDEIAARHDLKWPDRGAVECVKGNSVDLCASPSPNLTFR